MSERAADTPRESIPLGRWLAGSTLLASIGLLGFPYLATQLATPADGGNSVRKAQIAVVIWARVVLVKGLLPHLWITIVLWRWLEHRFPAQMRRERTSLLAGMCAAAATSTIVVSQLLTADVFDLPRVVVDGPSTLLRTSLELTLGSWLAAASPHLLFERAARRRGVRHPVVQPGRADARTPSN